MSAKHTSKNPWRPPVELQLQELQTNIKAGASLRVLALLCWLSGWSDEINRITFCSGPTEQIHYGLKKTSCNIQVSFPPYFDSFKKCFLTTLLTTDITDMCWRVPCLISRMGWLVPCPIPVCVYVIICFWSFKVKASVAKCTPDSHWHYITPSAQIRW